MQNEKLKSEVKSILLDVDAQRLTVEAAQKKITDLYAGWFKDTLIESLPGFLAGVMADPAAATQEGV